MKGAIMTSGWKSSGFLGQLWVTRNLGRLEIGIGTGQTTMNKSSFSQCSACSSRLFSNARIPNLLLVGRNFSLASRQLASKAASSKEKAEEPLQEEEGSFQQLDVIQPEPVVLTEDEILAKRNKSRLRPYHQRTLLNEVPHPEPTYWTHHTVKYKRRTYGIYGEQSGVNPGILWPTHEDLESRLEYESIAYPFTFHEMVEKKKELRRLEKEENERRAAEVEKKMGLVEKMKKDIFDRKAAKEKEVAAAKAKREILMEEVRRHFGYTVDTRDEKFQELLEKKEKAQKKAQKEAKKLERQKAIMEKLTQALNTDTKVEHKKEEPVSTKYDVAEPDDETKKKKGK